MDMDIDTLDGRLRSLIMRARDADAAWVDAEVHAVLCRDAGGPPPPYATDLVTAMGLLPYGTWFSWTHFGFSLVPNVPVPGIPMTVAVDHYPEEGSRQGAPVAYEAMAFDSPGSRAALPRLVLLAVAMSRRTPVLKALATRDRRIRVVQTGRGPLLAFPDVDDLKELPFGKYLTRDGVLVPYDEVVHGPGRVEAPDD